MTTRIYVTIGGGCYLGARDVPTNCQIEVIDWDNLLDDEGGPDEWRRTNATTKAFVQTNYPHEYKLIRDRLEARGESD